MEQFTIYYGTPEGKNKKIGVDSSYPNRLKQQKILDGQVLEVHTCVYEVSDREQALQRQHGVKVDDTPYYVTYFKNKNPEQRAKISASLMGKTPPNKGIPMTQEQKTKISDIPKSKEHRAKLSRALITTTPETDALVIQDIKSGMSHRKTADKHSISRSVVFRIKHQHE